MSTEAAGPASGAGPSGRVLIAGAGPVGLATALVLARAGVEVVVLERGDGPGTASRASTLHPPSLEFLDELGVLAPVLHQGLRSDTFQLRGLFEGIIAEFDLSVLADDTRFPYRVQLEQDKICRILAEALLAHPTAELRTGHEVLEVAQDARGVTLRCRAGERELTIEGAWLVGADGSRSAVRESLGIAHEGITYAERFLVVSTPEELREVLDDLALVNYVTDPDEWVVLLRTPDHWRLLFPVAADEAEGDVLEEAALQARVQRVVPRERPWTLVAPSLYEIHQRVASHFRDGRVLLAGDAAHLNNPLGGLGMNSGLLDAQSLGARLTRVWADQAPEAELDEWAEQRRRVALDVVDQATRANKQRMEQAAGAQRTAALAEQRALAADPVRARAHLRRVTLLDVARSTP